LSILAKAGKVVSGTVRIALIEWRKMADTDNRGLFYLGRAHDLAKNKTAAEPLLYDSGDLTTHAVCVGMTGSGKTGLCITLLEEAALDGISAIAIDPKGDLGNLLLAFPNLAPSDFRPWIDTQEAGRRQMSPDEFAASQAELWRNGLAKWDQGPERIRRFCDAVERVIYTPGSSAGVPITVLKSFRAPPKELLDDLDAFNERIASATSGLLALLGIDADPVRSREHIFLSNVFAAAWRDGKDLDLHELIQRIQRPPIDRVGAVDVETFFPAADRNELAMSLNNLLASPSFAAWTQGEPLDIARMLYTPDGKPRLAIVSIAHLDDAQRMFFVTILLNEILSWIRTQPGTSSLRALLYMDEVFGYFPPLANPPAKRPMLTLLKQARAYGLGCVLATQNPVDLDYKGLSNAGTWFLGRLQTERDKARVIEGLEGASAEAGAGFDRQKMEATLAALGARVFLMNNVHQDKPVVFHTRWAMSYLCGPLTRTQIKTLMDPVRAGIGTAPERTEPAAGTKESPRSRRPILPAGIPEKFARIKNKVVETGGDRVEYRPALLGHGKVHFVRKSDGIDEWRERMLLKVVGEMRPTDMWQGASPIEHALAFDAEPHPSGQFAPLPAEFAREKSYSAFERSLRDHLYREETLKRWKCEALDETSRTNEDEMAFRKRLIPQLEQRLRDERVKLQIAFDKKFADAEARIRRAEARVSTQRWQFAARVGRLAWAVVDTAASAIGRGLPGRRRSLNPAITSAATERGQQSSAQLALDKAIQDRDRLEQEYQEKLLSLEASFDPVLFKLETIELKPQKSDVEVDEVSLVWLAFRIDSAGAAEPIY
jgi:hypothetical protein